MDGMPKICEGMVFVMLLGRNSHLYSVRGTMEKLYGYDRIQTTKWTNNMLEYLFDQWAFLLDLNEERLSNKMVEYCTFLGTKANPVDLSACESYLCIDGVNVLPYVPVALVVPCRTPPWATLAHPSHTLSTHSPSSPARGFVILPGTRNGTTTGTTNITGSNSKE